MKFILFAIAILFTGMSFAQGVPPEQKFPKVPLGTKHFKLPSATNTSKLPLELRPMPKEVIVLKDGTVLRDMDKSQLIVSPSIPQAKYLGTLPNGNTAFALPQDKMPCIVPNENASVPMPNVSGLPTLPYRYKGPGAIPNPSVPVLINPKKK